VDGALTVQLEALRGSSFVPLRQRVEKVLEEERFHAAHGAAWFRRMAGAGAAARQELDDAAGRMTSLVLPWFGPDSENGRALHVAGVVDATGSGLRARFIERVAPLLALVDTGDALLSIEPDFSDFDESMRRPRSSAPDAETITRVRGDRNRAFLMD
jgi:1,2-phenylacetyl-CoA epoxidase catalytic subunit